MSAGVFPAFFLGRDVSGSKKWGAVCAASYLVLAELVYSTTFMAEIVYIPLGLALAYGFYRFLSGPAHDVTHPRRQIALAFVLGIGTYLLYLGKEVALAFPVAYTLYVLWELVFPLSAAPRREKLYGLLSYYVGFLLPFLAMKATFFSGFGNSYNQQNIEVLFEAGRPAYLVYSFFYYLGNVLLAFGVFPILLPLVFYRRLPENIRRFVRFIVPLAVTIALVVAYTISVREDFGELVPRTHIRYISFLCIPFLALLLPVARAVRPGSVPRALFVAVAALCLLLPFYHGIREGAPVDQIMSTYMRLLSVHLPMTAIRLLIAAALIIGCAVLLWKPRLFLALFCAGFCLMQLYGNFSKTVDFRRVWSVKITEPIYEELCELDSFLAAHPDEQFLFISYSQFNEAVDTFVLSPNLRQTYLKALGDLNSNDVIDLNGVALFSPFLSYNDLAVDYLILPQSLVLSDPALTERVLDYDDCGLCVYRLKEQNRFPRLVPWYEQRGSSVRLPVIGQNFYTLSSASSKDRFISNNTETFLVYGPYMSLPAGEYSVTFCYDTSACAAEPGAVAGYVDVYDDSQPAGEFARSDLTVGSDSITLESIVLPADTERLETRMFTSIAGIRPTYITITRTA